MFVYPRVRYVMTISDKFKGPDLSLSTLDGSSGLQVSSQS